MITEIFTCLLFSCTKYRFQRFQITAMSSKLEGKRSIVSKETNTDIIILDSEYKKSLKKESITPLESLSTEENQEYLEEERDMDNEVKSKSSTTISDVLFTRSKSTSSRTTVELESLFKIVDIVARVVFTATWLKNKFTSQEFMNKVIQTVRILCSILRSQYVRNVIQSIFYIGGKIIKLTANVNETNGTTNLLFEFFPTISSSN